MGPLLTTLSTWLLLGTTLVHGARTLAALDQATQAFADSWQEEHRVLICARAVAARKNLEAAAAQLATRRPDLAARLIAAATDLEDDLLPEAPDVPPPDVTGRCRSEGPQRLVASPHLERHMGQPEPWPNWVARWQEGGAE